MNEQATVRLDAPSQECRAAALIRTRVTSRLVPSYRKEIAFIATESNQRTKLHEPNFWEQVAEFQC